MSKLWFKLKWFYRHIRAYLQQDVHFFFAWYDFWIGVFYGTKKELTYVCFLPCCCIRIGDPYKMTHGEVSQVLHSLAGDKHLEIQEPNTMDVGRIEDEQ